VVLALQSILCGGLSGNFENFLIAITDHSVVAMNHQSGQRGVTATMRFAYHPPEDCTDPVMKQNRGANTGCFLSSLAEFLVGDDRVIGARYIGEQRVHLTSPYFVSFPPRHERTIRAPPIAALHHNPTPWLNKPHAPLRVCA
jgi:hypothetical protein